MAMIIPLFLPGRWHGRHNEDDADDDFDEIPAPTGLFSD
jgi:hypothetical protein